MVFGGINPSEEADGFPRSSIDPGVVSGCHILSFKSQRLIEEEFPADVAVADQAGVRGSAIRIAIQKVFDDLVFENIFGIDGVKGDI